MRPYISSMRNGVRNRGISWSGIGRTLLVEILVLLALSFAVVRYLEWSSDANQAEFMSATKSSPSDSNHSGEFSTPIRGEPVAIGRLELLQEPPFTLCGPIRIVAKLRQQTNSLFSDHAPK